MMIAQTLSANANQSASVTIQRGRASLRDGTLRKHPATRIRARRAQKELALGRFTGGLTMKTKLALLTVLICTGLSTARAQNASPSARTVPLWNSSFTYRGTTFPLIT